MVTVKLFVEGGGDNKALRTECRKAFNSFLLKVGFDGSMPRIVACGSRNNAYKDYCTAIKNGEKAVLLIDSEAPVDAESCVEPEKWKPWNHLKNRDGWDCPERGLDEECHLMVEVMESWFLTDTNALKGYYGQNFIENILPQNKSIEKISKIDILDALKKATARTNKGNYNKGSHSFKILSLIDSRKVTAKSQWAKRFVDLLTKKMVE
jgi:hypothetical protein